MRRSSGKYLRCVRSYTIQYTKALNHFLQDVLEFLDNMDTAPPTVNIKGVVKKLLRTSSSSIPESGIVSRVNSALVMVSPHMFSPSSMFIENTDFMDILGRISTTPSDSLFAISRGCSRCVSVCE